MNLKVLANKKILFDIVINILSSGIVSIITQLLIFPYIASNLSPSDFGTAVTLFGFNQLLCVITGNTINNIRLIYNDSVDAKGDFSTLNILSLAMTAIIAFVLFYIYGNNLSFFEMLILIILALLSAFRAYLLVFFRLKLVFINILITNLLIIVGYVLGLFLYQLISFWGVIFLSGELIGVIFLLLKTNYLKELPTRSSNFKKLSFETMNLSLSNIVNQSMSYLDRFLITPILGAASMSLFYTVSVFSKIINMVITPFNNVILSYMNKLNEKNVKKIFLYYNISLILLMIPVYFIMVWLTPYLLIFFYPEYANQGLYLVNIISLGNVLSLLSGTINPFVLKFSPMKYQTYIKFIYGIVYLVLALTLIQYLDLFGFAVATAIALLIKYILLFIIGYKNINEL